MHADFFFSYTFALFSVCIFHLAYKGRHFTKTQSHTLVVFIHIPQRESDSVCQAVTNEMNEENV